MTQPKRPRPAKTRKQSETEVSRRAAVQVLGAAGALMLGCSDDTLPAGGNGGSGGSGPSDGGAGAGPSDGGAGAGPSNGGAGPSGAGGEGGSGGQPAFEECVAAGNLTPAELLAPIQTIVVLCMENRSFDHYLGSLQLIEGNVDINGLVGTESNPDPDGNDVTVFNLLDFTPADPPHGWDACHAQYNNGANDGFVTEHAGASQNDVMGYHVRAQLPITYALADAGAICHNWFASVMGPTWPNRFFLHGATSEGNEGNTPVFGGFTSIFNVLDDAGISNVNYYHDLAWASGGYFKLSGNAGIETFFEDAAAGTLPEFSIIDPQFFGGGANDDHPDHDVQLGQALIASVYAALAASPQWSSCLLVITYDEHGGFFDHEPPPITTDENPDFARLGFRVPSLVLGPFVKQGCAIATQLEHVSVIKTLTVKHGLADLNVRVTAANDLSSCIQPAYFEDPQPPVKLPRLTIDLAAVKARKPRNHHPELAAIADSGLIPSHLDRRAESDRITEHVLRQAERLGVVRLV